MVYERMGDWHFYSAETSDIRRGRIIFCQKNFGRKNFANKKNFQTQSFGQFHLDDVD